VRDRTRGARRGHGDRLADPPKDFAFLKKDGVYHLFYIRHNDSLPNAATEKDFGHAVSTDLYHWQQLPPVMAVDPTGWDNQHVWAPHILYSLGLYWMYYTGVTQRPPQYVETQRIGLAVSTDLMDWQRLETPSGRRVVRRGHGGVPRTVAWRAATRS
jgi:sucrose-6-phosphate hydrolase SacC (GH32 family)